MDQENAVNKIYYISPFKRMMLIQKNFKIGGSLLNLAARLIDQS